MSDRKKLTKLESLQFASSIISGYQEHFSSHEDLARELFSLANAIRNQDALEIAKLRESKEEK